MNNLLSEILSECTKGSLPKELGSKIETLQNKTMVNYEEILKQINIIVQDHTRLDILYGPSLNFLPQFLNSKYTIPQSVAGTNLSHNRKINLILN